MPVLIRPIKLSGEEKKRFPNLDKIGIIIMVYSDVFFDLFYERHCKREHNKNIFTVFVKGETEKPSKKETRTFIESILLRFKFKEGTVLVEESLRTGYCARKWSKTENNFIDEFASAAILRFEDNEKIFKKKIAKLLADGWIVQSDVDAISAIKKDAEKNKQLIKFIWFVGHIDIDKSKRSY